MTISISRSSALVPPLLRRETLRDRVKLAIVASRTADGVANNFWFVGNLGLIHVEFFIAALDYRDEVSDGPDDEFKQLLAAWEEIMGIVLGELAPDFADYANPSFGSAMLETAEVSVKEPMPKTTARLTLEGHAVKSLAGQALAGLMKPNLVSDLIQRGALR